MVAEGYEETGEYDGRPGEGAPLSTGSDVPGGKILRRFLIAVQFLTVLPVRVRGEVSEADVARSAVIFPLVGLMQGLLLLLSAALFGRVFHSDLSTALLLLVLVLSNGGFHLDGLADTFDALAAKGDRERKLRAMKDSATGAAGVSAIVFVLALKYLSLKSVSNLSGYTFLSALVFMPMLSKWVMLPCMLHGKPAKEGGLGRIFLTGIRPLDVIAASLLVMAAMSVSALLLPEWTSHAQHVFNACAIFIIYVLGLFLCRFFTSRFGGLTGDTLGAAAEVTEVVFLWTVLIWSRLYI
jgi:adenosylcobinamide-GDP ribazoletransferase